MKFTPTYTPGCPWYGEPQWRHLVTAAEAAETCLHWQTCRLPDENIKQNNFIQTEVENTNICRAIVTTLVSFVAEAHLYSGKYVNGGLPRSTHGRGVPLWVNSSAKTDEREKCK